MAVEQLRHLAQEALVVCVRRRDGPRGVLNFDGVDDLGVLGHRAAPPRAAVHGHRAGAGEAVVDAAEQVGQEGAAGAEQDGAERTSKASSMSARDSEAT